MFGIVAVLAGLVFIGGAAVRRRTDAVHCTLNLLQLGVAVRMYIADYHTTPLVYYCESFPSDPRRPPSPPPDHNIAMVLGSYVESADLFYCPASRRYRPSHTYDFPRTSAGLSVSQIRTPASRALIMYDGFDRYTERMLRTPLTHGKQNALFLDGHVKAYDFVAPCPLWDPNAGGPWPPYWPPE